LSRAGFALLPAEGTTRVFTVGGLDSQRTGVFVGSGLGGGKTFLRNHTHHLLRKPRVDLLAYAQTRESADRATLERIAALMTHGRFNPFEVSMVMPNAAAAAIGIKYALTGPNQAHCLACATGTVAIGNAYRAVREGRVDVAISGGCEHFGDDHGHIFRSFDVAGTLVRDYTDAQTANRPFDVKRSGFLFSEGGAAVLVLEELDHALSRGATVLAEIIAFAETFDGYSMMRLAEHGEQIERMLRVLLAEAGVGPHDVDYINAHGTGTKNNDETEAEVIERLFGKSILVNSTKSLVGHAIGASGAIEILVTALSLRDQTAHVCKNLETPVRDINFVRTVKKQQLNLAISQSFAFGGHNAAVALKRFV
jgi:3-oxoacyl-[acyl-carrier-protein] synthase II